MLSLSLRGSLGFAALVTALSAASCDAARSRSDVSPNSQPATSGPRPSSGDLDVPVSVPKPTVVEYSSVGGTPLRGFLYEPSKAGPHPTVVYHHGSERSPSNFAGQAQFYVPRGFVLFVPHRRGHGLSAAAAQYPAEVLGRAGSPPQRLVGVLRDQMPDVSAAVEFVRRLRSVDRQRVAVAGCSLGGVLALASARRERGLRAAIDFAGGSIVWKSNPPLRQMMRTAAKDATTPVFFIQAANDYNTAPSHELSKLMRETGGSASLQIFPAHGSTPRQGHQFCAGGRAPAWGPAVRTFLTRAFAETPSQTD